MIPDGSPPFASAARPAGRFTLRLRLDDRPRTMRDLGYRHGFQILAGGATAILAVALYRPVDRLLGATNRLAWLAVAIAVVYLIWMLPTLVIAWIEPDARRPGWRVGAFTQRLRDEP